MKLRPFEDRVIVQQDEAKDITPGGIIVPDPYRQKPATGTIVEIGPGKPGEDQEKIGYFVNGEFVVSLKEVDKLEITDRVEPVYPSGFKRGDHVYFSQFAGAPIESEGKTYLCLRFTDIISRDE